MGHVALEGAVCHCACALKNGLLGGAVCRSECCVILGALPGHVVLEGAVCRCSCARKHGLLGETLMRRSPDRSLLLRPGLGDAEAVFVDPSKKTAAVRSLQEACYVARHPLQVVRRRRLPMDATRARGGRSEARSRLRRRRGQDLRIVPTCLEVRRGRSRSRAQASLLLPGKEEGPHLPIPHVKEQVKEVAAWASTSPGSQEAWRQPLFPALGNGIPNKAATVAGWQLLVPVDRTLGGHSARRSGAKFYARQGWHVTAIQHLCRWASSQVLEHVEEAYAEDPVAAKKPCKEDLVVCEWQAIPALAGRVMQVEEKQRAAWDLLTAQQRECARPVQAPRQDPVKDEELLSVPCRRAIQRCTRGPPRTGRHPVGFGPPGAGGTLPTSPSACRRPASWSRARSSIASGVSRTLRSSPRLRHKRSGGCSDVARKTSGLAS